MLLRLLYDACETAFVRVHSIPSSPNSTTLVPVCSPHLRPFAPLDFGKMTKKDKKDKKDDKKDKKDDKKDKKYVSHAIRMHSGSPAPTPLRLRIFAKAPPVCLVMHCSPLLTPFSRLLLLYYIPHLLFLALLRSVSLFA